jgi:hypothetical protein
MYYEAREKQPSFFRQDIPWHNADALGTTSMLEQVPKLNVCSVGHCAQQSQKSAQHTYEEAHKIFCKEAKVMQIDPRITYLC